MVDLRAVTAVVPVVGELAPAAYFGVLLAVEMAVALVVMVPVSRLAEGVGLKPVVAPGFAVYAVFPVVLIVAPADPLVYGAVRVLGAAVRGIAGAGGGDRRAGSA